MYQNVVFGVEYDLKTLFDFLKVNTKRFSSLNLDPTFKKQLNVLLLNNQLS